VFDFDYNQIIFINMQANQNIGDNELTPVTAAAFAAKFR